MINDLEVNKEKLGDYISQMIMDSNINGIIAADLKKLQNKIESRRARVKEYETKLKKKEYSNDAEKMKLIEFIKKVERIEGNYDTERRIFIKTVCVREFMEAARKVYSTLLMG